MAADLALQSEAEFPEFEKVHEKIEKLAKNIKVRILH